MKRYRIFYKQIFHGEILEDSYVRTVADYGELVRIENDLYQDPHVIAVWWEELE